MYTEVVGQLIADTDNSDKLITNRKGQKSEMKNVNYKLNKGKPYEI